MKWENESAYVEIIQGWVNAKILIFNVLIKVMSREHFLVFKVCHAFKYYPYSPFKDFSQSMKAFPIYNLKVAGSRWPKPEENVRHQGGNHQPALCLRLVTAFRWHNQRRRAWRWHFLARTRRRWAVLLRFKAEAGVDQCARIVAIYLWLRG